MRGIIGFVRMLMVFLFIEAPTTVVGLFSDIYVVSLATAVKMRGGVHAATASLVEMIGNVFDSTFAVLLTATKMFGGILAFAVASLKIDGDEASLTDPKGMVSKTRSATSRIVAKLTTALSKGHDAHDSRASDHVHNYRLTFPRLE